MAAIKTLLILAADYEDEINEAIDKAKETSIAARTALLHNAMAQCLPEEFWYKFTNNEKISKLIYECFQMNLITENGKLNRCILHDAVPFISKEYY